MIASCISHSHELWGEYLIIVDIHYIPGLL